MSCYGWGKNDTNQIVYSINDFQHGDNEKKHHSEGPVEEKKTLNLPHKIIGISKVVQVAVGTKHCVFLDKYGYVWTSGRNVEGQRGFVQKSIYKDAVTKIGGKLCEEVVVSVAAGGNMTFAITTSGSVYNWGLIPVTEDEHGNSFWDKYNEKDKLMLVMDDQKASQKTTRTSTSAMANSEKETYLQRVIKRSESAYYYNDPSLFNTTKASATQGVTQFKVKLRKCFDPKLILSLEQYKCIKIACGCAHTLALAKDGTLLSRGYNDRGQLGNATRINSPLFQQVKFSFKTGLTCIDIACGSDHNLALMSNGALFAFGAGALGQLGLGPNQKDTLQPKEILFFRKQAVNVQQIACGQYHSVVIGNTSNRGSKDSTGAPTQSIYSFGLSEYDIHNINGHGRFRNVRESRYYFSPRKLEAELLKGKAIIAVGCTAHSTIVQLNNGGLYTWGWSSSGLLGKKDTRTPGISRVEGMNGVTTFYAGENNVFAIVGADEGNFHGLKFRPLLNDEIFSDIKLEMGDSCVYLHSFILEKRCPALLDAFQEIKTDGSKNVYAAAFDTKKDVILHHAILDYIYTDHCTLPKHLKFELAKLALKLGLKHLYARCIGMSDMKVEEQIQDSSIFGGNRQSLLDSIKGFNKEKLKKMTPSDTGTPQKKAYHTEKKVNSNDLMNTSIIRFHENGHESESRYGETRDEAVTTKYIESSFEYDFHSMLLHTSKDTFDVFFRCTDMLQTPTDRDSILPNVKPDIVGAHRAVMIIVPFFRSLLLGGFSESSTSGEINIDCTSNIFRSILGWVYSGSENIINEANALGILMYSKRFMLEELSQICELFVIKNLDDDNAKFLKEFAEHNDFPRLLSQSGSRIGGDMMEKDQFRNA